MSLPRAVFADTSFYIALSSRKDATRPRAIAWQRRLAAERCQIVTTEAVLWEWLNFSAASPVARAVAVQGYERINADPLVEVVNFNRAACEAAVQLYTSRPDKAWGVID